MATPLVDGSKGKTERRSYCLLLTYAVSFIVLLAAIVFPYCHQFSSGLPPVLPTDAVKQVNTEAIANIFLQVVFFLATLSFGLSALSAFVFGRKVRSSHWLRGINAIGFSLITYFLFRSITYAYEAYISVVVQVDYGTIFLTILNPSLKEQATSVVLMAAVVFILTAVNHYCDFEEV